MEIANLYQGALMEHNSYPSCKYDLPAATHSHEGINPSCGDDLVISLNVEDGTIQEAAFQGSGCAVSQASADIMAELITGATLQQAGRLVASFQALIRGEELSDELREELGEAIEFETIARMPARVKCALLAWNTLEHILAEAEGMLAEGDTAPTTTEDL